jgi:hypothetical protein
MRRDSRSRAISESFHGTCGLGPPPTRSWRFSIDCPRRSTVDQARREGEASAALFTRGTFAPPGGLIARLRHLARKTIMKTKPELKVGDRVASIGDDQKRGVVSRVFRLAGLWWLEFEGVSNWRFEPSHFKRVA